MTCYHPLTWMVTLDDIASRLNASVNKLGQNSESNIIANENTSYTRVWYVHMKMATVKTTFVWNLGELLILEVMHHNYSVPVCI